MTEPSLSINFANIGEYMIFAQDEYTAAKEIPSWTRFKDMSCPGNIAHGPDITHCRLGAQMDRLIHYFSTLKSIDPGELTLRIDEELELKIKSDAQTILYNAIWFILLHSQCSAFKYNQWARSNYLPTSDPDRMFYTLFSTFLVQNFAEAPNTAPDIASFKAEIHLMLEVLNNLLERIRKGVKFPADSVNNGIVMFSNLIQLLDLDFEDYYSALTERIKTGHRASKWV